MSTLLRRQLLAGAAGTSALLLAGCASFNAKPTVVKKQIPINGGQLYVEEAGTGPAVVLLHGFSLDVRMWDDQFLTLAKTRRVVRYDLRGFGQSSLPTAAYSHADDCKKLMDTLGITSAALVGLSAGGRVALDVATRYPAAVSKLVLIDTFIGGYAPTPAYGKSLGDIIGLARGGDLAKAKTQWLAHPLFVPAARQAQVSGRLAAMVQSWSGFQFTQANPEVPLNPNALSQLESLKPPLLVITGQLDIEDVQIQAKILATRVKGSKSVEIPGVGHMSNMQAPDKVNAEILRFIS